MRIRGVVNVALPRPLSRFLSARITVDFRDASCASARFICGIRMHAVQLVSFLSLMALRHVTVKMTEEGILIGRFRKGELKLRMNNHERFIQ